MSDPCVASALLKAIDAGARAKSELFDAVLLPELTKLAAAGAIEIGKGGIRIPGEPRRDVKTHRATLDAEVLAALEGRAPTSGQELAAALGLPETSVRAALRRLRGAGLVSRAGTNRWCRWTRREAA